MDEVRPTEESGELKHKESFYREPKKFGQEIATQRKSVKLAQGKDAACQCTIF